MPMPRRILLGLLVQAPEQDVQASLHALHENTPLPLEVRLLAAPSGEAQARALRPLLEDVGGLRQHWGPPGQGTAAAFNRLIAEAADVYVLLEAGARPAPGWLDLLLAALDADPSHGLAGPSTNRCWNEQGIASEWGSGAAGPWREAEVLLARHGRTWRGLEPLHSLSDFCYALKREVVEAVGAADEAYGDGPCWEMDYNIRAARAGFRGLWVPAAYVHRAPLTAQRRETEARTLEHSKRRYQDRFCAQRSPDRPPGAYHAHCRGDACKHFARAELLPPRQPLPAPPADAGDAPPPHQPLVSCIMPTRGRARFVAQALSYFRRQDWPARELIIVYEDEQDLPEQGLDDARIRCVRMAAGSSIGAKRNEAVRQARGELIAHWDDDDWYADERLSRQLAPLLQGVADISGLNDILFMSLAHAEWWQASPALFRRLFVENVSGGTLVYWRRLWLHQGRYPPTSLREDADFMEQVMRSGARLCRLPGRELCVYVRHQSNTWKFRAGSFLQAQEWTRTQAPAFLARDMDFYFPPGPPPEVRREPLVSCIMPTANRRAFIEQALQDYLAQDYPHRELIVVDDGRDPVADLMPRRDDVRYIRLEQRRSVGAKRNIACEMARGELVAHWDDDDWRAPGWLRSQVEVLQSRGADVCGLDKVFFYRPEGREAWRYVWDGAAHWVCGGTLCYRRDYWRRFPFPDLDIGEDNAFVWKAPAERVAVNPDTSLYVARVHAGNTSTKATQGRRWHAWPVDQLERLMKGFRPECPECPEG